MLTIETHTSPDDTNIQIHDPNELLSDMSESQVHNSQQNPQTTQPMILQQPNIQFEKLSLHFNEIPDGDHNQNDLQIPNATLDNQSTAHTVDSNAILVTIRLVTEQDSHHLAQDPSIVSTKNTTITKAPTQPTFPETKILLGHLNQIHLLRLHSLNNQNPLITLSMLL